MVWQILIFILLALIISYDRRKRYFKEQLGLFAAVFCLYAVFAVLTNSYVENPMRDFFINTDQIFFYRESFYLKDHPIRYIYDVVFSDVRYSELPLAIFYFSVLMKWAQAMGVSDLILFVKFNSAFIGALIPLLMYKMIRLFDKQRRIVGLLIGFAVFSPLLYLSVQVMRDVHIALLFTMGAYVVLNNEMHFRLLILLVLFVLIYYLRVENGLFFILFIALQQYDHFRRCSLGGKVVIAMGLLALLVIAIVPTLDVFAQTQEGYEERALDAASSSSLGAKLLGFPFPVNYLGMAAFGQLQPFPLWWSLSGGETYSHLRLMECVQPFFWLPVILAVVFGGYKYRKLLPAKVLMFLCLSLLYIIAVSAAEMNVRRQFAVYPLLFCICLYLQSRCGLKMKLYQRNGVFILVILHLVYWVIK